jgi:hypothetical protein
VPYPSGGLFNYPLRGLSIYWAIILLFKLRQTRKNLKSTMDK